MLRRQRIASPGKTETLVVSRPKEFDVAFKHIAPGVRDHVGAKIAPPVGKESIEQSQNGDNKNGFPPLICVSKSKQKRLRQYCHSGAAGNGPDLLLKIAPIHDFFTKTGSSRQRKPRANIKKAMWRKIERAGRSLRRANQIPGKVRSCRPEQPKRKGNKNIYRYRAPAFPASSGKAAQSLAVMHAHQNEVEHQPLSADIEGINQGLPMLHSAGSRSGWSDFVDVYSPPCQTGLNHEKNHGVVPGSDQAAGSSYWLGSSHVAA